MRPAWPRGQIQPRSGGRCHREEPHPKGARLTPKKNRRPGGTGTAVGNDDHMKTTSQNYARVQNEPAVWKRAAEILGHEYGVSASTVKRCGIFAEAYERIRDEEPRLPHLDALKRAKEYLAAQRKIKVRHAEPPLNEMLAKRWEKFIKDIPPAEHSAVWIWIEAKRKEEAA
jgi:hypothetical protein